MAHVTFLFDVFPAQRNQRRKRRRDLSALLLCMAFFRIFALTTQRMNIPLHGRDGHSTGQLLELPGAEELTDLLTSLPRLLSTAVASVATGQVGLKLVPVITLTLEAQDRALIHHVHEVSDWVITVDRNMGIEFFDHGGKPGRPDYLIDHSPDMTSDFGHRLFITSRSLQELQMMLEPALTQYGLPADQGHANRASASDSLPVWPSGAQAASPLLHSVQRSLAWHWHGSISTIRGFSGTTFWCRSMLTLSCTTSEKLCGRTGG